MKQKKGHSRLGPTELEEIKKLVIIAMFSDDELMEHLVLKGGNALDLVHRISTRASVDVDFSMEADFPGGRDALRLRVERTLRDTFRERGYEAFDVNVEVRPPHVTPDLADFWGGYQVDFKLIEKDRYRQLSSDVEKLRKQALPLGQGTRFLIDISKFEYTAAKEPWDLEGYRIFVYSPAMMACEKLRAICQQMPEYGSIIKRARQGSPRARDFLDVHTLVTERRVDLTLPANQQLLRGMFKSKKVDLSLLGLVAKYREFHRTDWHAVTATTKPGVKLQDFDFYFDYLLGLVERLKPLWDV